MDNSDNGFLLKTRTVRAAKPPSESHHYPTTGQGTVTSTSMVLHGTSTVTGGAAGGSATIVKKSIVGKGVPPPIPPNKPAIPLFKSGGGASSAMNAFNLLKGGSAGSSDKGANS